MKNILYPGSFDPVTLGHMDIIQRASSLADRLLVAVLINPNKTGMFPPQERVEMLLEACTEIQNVKVIMFTGLLADLARREQVQAIIKGVRGVIDLENETTMARANKQLGGGLETLFLPSSSKVEHISSTLVREIAAFHGNVDEYVPACVARRLRER